ncbi:MAG: hypothetical protein ACRCS9_14240 [Hyphomicrobium sp.]
MTTTATQSGQWLRPKFASAWTGAVAHTPTGHRARTCDTLAALAAMGMLAAMAALPNKDDATAAAKTAPTTSSVPGRETTFGAYLGAPYHYPSDLLLEKPGAHDVSVKKIEWYTLPFDNPLYYGARIQRWFSGGTFGSMIDFTHSKAYAPLDQQTTFDGMINGKRAPETAKISDFFKRLEFTHGHNMLTLNGLVRLFQFSTRIVPYAGVGAGASFPHTEVHVATDAQRTYEYQYTGPNAQALFGLELRLATGSVFLEYKFTLADYRAPITHRDGSLYPIDMWNQFTRWYSGEAPPGGFVTTRLTSHQVIGGFLVRFVPEGGAAAR